MSAALLSYPRKPNELTDDLESFVYVISLAILRFHEHTLTQFGNTILGRHVSLVYDAADRTNDGYWVSTDKLNRIRGGNPGFDLLNKKSKLSTLLRSLWQLGRAHYAKLDLLDMQERWGVGPVVKDPEESPTLANNLLFHSAFPKTMSDRSVRSEVEADLLEEDDLLEEEGGPPLVLPDPTPRVQDPRDFNRHIHIYKIFRSLAESDWGTEDTTKTPDQFVDMVAFEPMESVRSARSGVKRGSQAVDSGNGGSRAKKSRLG